MNSPTRSNTCAELLRVLTAGSVDDGKSTLIGRLLHDSHQVWEDQLDALTRDADRRGTGLDLAHLVDGLRAERAQGITIDVAYRYFSTPARRFILADCPGHEQYTRNMATGASTADLAIVLVDAAHGLTEQTRRHSFIASLLGIRHVVLAINKMDLVEYRQDVFEKIRSEYADFASRLAFGEVQFIPLSALHGDNVVHQSDRMPWYGGGALLPWLETVHVASDRNLIDLRVPIQLPILDGRGFRGYAGFVASGVLRTGDEVVVLPGGRRTHVERIVTREGDLTEARPPQSVVVTLADQVDVGRGHLLAHPNNAPEVRDSLEAMIVWMGEAPLVEGQALILRHINQSVPCVVSTLRYRTHVSLLRRESSDHLAQNEIGRVALSLRRPLPLDPYDRNRATGAFVLIDPATNLTVGAGMVVARRPALTSQAGAPKIAHVEDEAAALEVEAALSGQPVIRLEDFPNRAIAVNAILRAGISVLLQGGSTLDGGPELVANEPPARVVQRLRRLS